MSDTVISYTFTFLITNMLDNFYIYSDFPAGVVAELQQIAILIGHIARDADLVSVEVEVVGLLAVFVVFADVV